MNLNKREFVFKLEKIRFVRNFFIRLCKGSFDWLPYFSDVKKRSNKKKKIAVLTQAFNEGDMLLLWEKYYADLVGYENLFIINNGGTNDSCGRLNPKVTVLNLPATEVDLNELAEINGYFQRLLLLRYDWVLKVDVDEFMVFKFELASTLNGLSKSIYKPERAIAALHDVDQNESSFDYSKSVSKQRKFFVDEPSVLKKPSLSAIPATWTAGNHEVMEGNKVLSGMWMIHLRYIDYERLKSRNYRWAQMNFRDEDKRHSIFKPSIEEYTKEEIKIRMSEKGITLPDWVRRKI